MMIFYVVWEYKELFHKIRNTIPGVTISTDIIVGFPQESDEAFEHTLDVVRECRFDNAYTFIYSPRPGTPAAKMEDDIDLQTKKERLYRLNELWNRQANENHQQLVGKIVPVLVDGPSKKDPNVYCGYSDTSIPVNFTGENIQEGDIVNVKIEQARTFSLNGIKVD